MREDGVAALANGGVNQVRREQGNFLRMQVAVAAHEEGEGVVGSEAVEVLLFAPAQPAADLNAEQERRRADDGGLLGDRRREPLRFETVEALETGLFRSGRCRGHLWDILVST